jgi:hypothetical protein
MDKAIHPYAAISQSTEQHIHPLKALENHNINMFIKIRGA